MSFYYIKDLNLVPTFTFVLTSTHHAVNTSVVVRSRLDSLDFYVDFNFLKF
jgi:hypothetical protein